MELQSKRLPFIIGGVLMFIAGLFSTISVGFGGDVDSGMLFVGFVFLVGSVFLVWIAYKKKSVELIIGREVVVIRGLSVPRSNIASFRVATITHRGGHGNYAIFHFNKMPHLPLLWTINKFFERIFFAMPGAPKQDNSGLPIPAEPRFVIGLNAIEEDHNTVNREYAESERAGAVND